METWADSEILYRGSVVTLRVGNVSLDNGDLAKREVVEHPGGVCVVPYTGHSVILVKQFRIAVGEEVLEVPAGKLEPGEEPMYRCAVELEEETGYVASQLISLGYIYLAVGFCSEKAHLFLALDLKKTAQRLEHDERIELVELSLQEVRQGLRERKFKDGKTIVLLEALLTHLGER